MINRDKFKKTIDDFGHTNLAEKMRCTRPNISKMFLANTSLDSMSVRKFGRICDALGVSPHDYIEGGYDESISES